jgi:hypothetical protein
VNLHSWDDLSGLILLLDFLSVGEELFHFLHGLRFRL